MSEELEPTVAIAAPPPGLLAASVNVRGIKNAAGDSWVRVMVASIAGLSIIDLPTREGDSRPAEEIARAIVTASREISSGLVVPG